MNSRLTVSTECPSCGAPLDFREGSTALQCGHCRSHLLVTGRKQVLSYAVPPTLTVQGAVAVTSAAHKRNGSPCRVVHPQLYFLPYYRLTGHDFLWEWGPPSGEKLDSVQGNNEESRFREWESQRSLVRSSGAIQFRDHYIEKNFLACDLRGVDVYSLGVRPSVLRLRLFHRAMLETDRRIVSVTIAPEMALIHGMKTEVHDILYRQVLGSVLSVIYFPFWVVEVECRGKQCLTIIDAVAGTLITLDASPALYTVLNRGPSADPQVIGFRPLVCPNCGWDLPLRPDDSIFFCSSCNRVWQITGQELSEVSYQVAEQLRVGTQGSLQYLPFWVLQEGSGHGFQRFFVPAFRCRRLKLLNDLAMNMSRRQPAYSVTNSATPELQGCYYDQEDAMRLAQFASAGLRAKNPEELRTMQDEQLPISGATLTWFPFADQGYSLVEPFTKTSLPRQLLL
jgi:ribosomal protein L37AE/L43A